MSPSLGCRDAPVPTRLAAPLSPSLPLPAWPQGHRHLKTRTPRAKTSLFSAEHLCSNCSACASTFSCRSVAPLRSHSTSLRLALYALHLMTFCPCHAKDMASPTTSGQKAALLGPFSSRRRNRPVEHSLRDKKQGTSRNVGSVAGLLTLTARQASLWRWDAFDTSPLVLHLEYSPANTENQAVSTDWRAFLSTILMSRHIPWQLRKAEAASMQMLRILCQTRSPAQLLPTRKQPEGSQLRRRRSSCCDQPRPSFDRTGRLPGSGGLS